MTGMTRAALAAITATFAFVPFAMLWSSAPPDNVVRMVLSILAVIGGSLCALLWVLRWPTASESVGYAACASVSIGMAALAQSDPAIALLACTSFVAVSAYVAIFHTPVLLVANTAVAVLVPIAPAVELAAASGGAVRATCLYLLVLAVNFAVPFGIQLLIQALGADLLEADRDPLTGLLNRRAFYERACQLVAAYGRSDSHLVVALIDLDRFKRLNDTEGHAAGDRALIAVGHVLRERTREGAIVGRAGGEEFLVADVFVDPRSLPVGTRLCDGVAALPYGLTASVGTASARCDQISASGDSNRAITELIDAADAAMYEAKRNGGNQSRHRFVHSVSANVELAVRPRR
jgi:diguanylate cyclase (GGDEF)-like protein